MMIKVIKIGRHRINQLFLQDEQSCKALSGGCCEARRIGSGRGSDYIQLQVQPI